MLHFLLLLVALLCSTSWSQAQQSGRSTRYDLLVDNDIFRVDVPLRARTDREYTHGASLRLEAVRRQERLSTTSSLELGQRLFTPSRFGDPSRERPYAGWLFVRAQRTTSSAARRRLVGVEVGVSGDPSLGRETYEVWHEMIDQPMRGWETEVGFHPGVVLQLEERYLPISHAPEGAHLHLMPLWGGELGNVRRNAYAGGEILLSALPMHPWRADPQAGNLYLVGGWRTTRVLKNFLLEADVDGDGADLEVLPWVRELSYGLGVRLGAWRVDYRTVRRTREYQTQPRPHGFGAIRIRLDHH